MEITTILERLDAVKQTGRHQWQARCPAHEDHKASLSISTGDNGKVLLHCHAACPFEDVKEALGLSNGEVMGGEPTRSKISKTYRYDDENGLLLFETVRYNPKDFRQRRPDGNGGWIWNLKDTTRVLYRLPELLTAEPEAPVFICEGEKDCDRLADLRLMATTCPMGAGKWRTEYNAFLKDSNVCILPDLDAPGRKHAEQVARALYGTAATVKVIELPGIPAGGKDVADWLAAGHTKDELLGLIERAEPYESTGPAEAVATVTDFNLTDSGNAERLASEYGDMLRYCWTWGKWLAWDGRRWNIAKGQELARKLALQAVRGIQRDAAKAESVEDKDRLFTFGLRSERQSNLLAMLAAAQATDPFPTYAEDFDRDLMLFNCRNGTINLTTGELRKHDPADLITKLCPVDYEPEATFPMWEDFLWQAMDNFPELVGFLQRAVGYCLTGLTSEKKLFFIHGPKDTGKSTFLEAVKAVFGDYGHTTSFETFLRRDHAGGVRNDIAQLCGARLVVSNEVEDGKRLAEGIVKTLTGGDTIRARFLYSEGFEFIPQFKLFLAANHAPRVDDRDAAIWRRILRIRFEHSIPEWQQDPKIKATLGDPKVAGPAILAWAVQGCLKWQTEGLEVPLSIRSATEAYRHENDPLREFLQDNCIVSEAATVPVKTLRKGYEDWCDENGVKFSISARNFNDRLRELGCEARPTRYADKVCKCWHGIGLGSVDEDLPI